MGVVLTKPVDIDIYKVDTEDGDEIDFYAELDKDGDIIVTLKHDSVVSYVKELLSNELTLTNFLESCCDEGLEDAVVTIIKELQSRGVSLRKLYKFMEISK